MDKIHKSWKPLFDNYYFNIPELYASEKDDIEIYPPKDQLFRVFEMDLNEIRIVLLGQDPYHRKGQAVGLSFSVPNGVTIPPSLKNIYKELIRCFPDRHYEFKHGNLEQWFYREKIFLLNASLTVIQAVAGSQMSIWEDFTNDVIKFISEHNKNCVFVLLGNFAKEKSVFIQNKEKIVEEVHPSPLARSFVGSNVFKRVEDCLGNEIDWSI